MARQFASDDSVRDALTSREFVLFKHSLICPISTRAFAEYELFVDAHPGVPTAWIDVIGQRPLSQLVERLTGIQHESPQVLVVRNGLVVWHASHGAITSDALAAATHGPGGSTSPAE